MRLHFTLCSSAASTKGALDTTPLGDAHVKLLECLRGVATPEAATRAAAADAPFRNTVAQLLRLMKPFSCG
jgi:hypothetical protein